MKVVIYTAIFGSYDTLKDPLITHPDVEFIYFSEKKIGSLIHLAIPATHEGFIMPRKK